MTSACFSRGNTGFSRNATLVAKVNPPALAGEVFNFIFIVRAIWFLDMELVNLHFFYQIQNWMISLILWIKSVCQFIHQRSHMMLLL